ncbi:ParB/RepB/Spo0J family partition protein [Kitasatospora sp. NPDC093550]|uniref:ParB/RepB/Spo0J family partition protein n=1 Tax=Kitasatospora sp. NPDC093550 TaxID=3364089 RepID=UPI0037F124D4
MSGRRALGRGLDALIRTPASAEGTTAVAAARASTENRRGLPRPVPGALFAELPVDVIKPNPRQPRDHFDPDKLNELVASIKEVGLLQPIVVREVAPDSFELIMGERRLRASREAGLERIPAIVRATEDDKLLLDALLENLQRAELNPLEEAAAYDQLLRDFSCTHDQLADRVGRSRSHVSNTLRLLKLPASVQTRVAAGTVMAGHARALLGLADPERQEQVAARINAEGLSVRNVEEIVTMINSAAESEADKPKRQAPKAGRLLSPAFNDLASRLSDRFDTRVKVEVSQRGGKLGKGKVVLEFGSVEDLNRILDSMAPGEDGLRLSQG